MTPKQKRSLVMASIIGTLFGCYDKDERTKLHDELHRRIGKGIRKQVKLFGEECIVKVSHDDGNAIWRDSVDHFADKDITIEASSTILELWAKDEKNLSKHYGLSKGNLARWASPSKRKDAVELENNGRAVADYVFKKVSELYGIEVEKKVSILERLKNES